jgi:hypothetical protein
MRWFMILLYCLWPRMSLSGLYLEGEITVSDSLLHSKLLWHWKSELQTSLRNAHCIQICNFRLCWFKWPRCSYCRRNSVTAIRVGISFSGWIKIRFTVFWNVTPCTLLAGYQCFVGTCWLLLHPSAWKIEKVSPKLWNSSSKLHGIPSQKTVILTLHKSRNYCPQISSDIHHTSR